METENVLSPTRRRLFTALGVVLVGGWVWGAPRLPGLFGEDLSFEPIKSAPGFQRLETQIAGGSASLFAGLDQPDPNVSKAFTKIEAAPCDALFAGDVGTVPIALFSDFNCPNCPAMDQNVLNVIARTPGTSLHRHELPLLGRTSVVASRAVLAADKQGKYTEMHDALFRTPAVTDLTFVRRLAEGAGVDPDQLEHDMAQPDVTTALAVSKALSQYLGLIGTPAAVIGKTVVLGVQSEKTIAAIIAHEKEKGVTCS